MGITRLATTRRPRHQGILHLWSSLPRDPSRRPLRPSSDPRDIAWDAQMRNSRQHRHGCTMRQEAFGSENYVPSIRLPPSVAAESSSPPPAESSFDLSAPDSPPFLSDELMEIVWDEQMAAEPRPRHGPIVRLDLNGNPIDPASLPRPRSRC